MPKSTTSAPGQKDYSTIWSIGIALILALVAGYYIRFPDAQYLATVKVIYIDGAYPSVAEIEVEMPVNDEHARFDFGDGSPSIPIKKGTNQFTHQYRRPGVYNLAVRSSEAVMAEPVQAYCQSKGWELIASADNCFNAFVPLPFELAMDTGILTISKSFVSRNGADTTRHKLKSLFCYQPILSTEEGVTITATLKPGSDCTYYSMLVAGDKQSFRIEKTASNNFLTGECSNIRAVNLPHVQDQAEWQTLILDISSNELKVLQDSLPVISQSSHSLGTIRGIEIQFNGSFQIDRIEISGPLGLAPATEYFD